MTMIGAMADGVFLFGKDIELTPIEVVEKLEKMTSKICFRLKSEEKMAFYCGDVEEIVAKVIPLVLEELGILK